MGPISPSTKTKKRGSLANIKKKQAPVEPCDEQQDGMSKPFRMPHEIKESWRMVAPLIPFARDLRKLFFNFLLSVSGVSDYKKFLQNCANIKRKSVKYAKLSAEQFSKLIHLPSIFFEEEHYNFWYCMPVELREMMITKFHRCFIDPTQIRPRLTRVTLPYEKPTVFQKESMTTLNAQYHSVNAICFLLDAKECIRALHVSRAILVFELQLKRRIASKLNTKNMESLIYHAEKENCLSLLIDNLSYALFRKDGTGKLERRFYKVIGDYMVPRLTYDIIAETFETKVTIVEIPAVDLNMNEVPNTKLAVIEEEAHESAKDGAPKFKSPTPADKKISKKAAAAQARETKRVLKKTAKPLKESNDNVPSVSKAVAKAVTKPTKKGSETHDSSGYCSRSCSSSPKVLNSTNIYDDAYLSEPDEDIWSADERARQVIIKVILDIQANFWKNLHTFKRRKFKRILKHDDFQPPDQNYYYMPRRAAAKKDLSEATLEARSYNVVRPTRYTEMCKLWSDPLTPHAQDQVDELYTQYQDDFTSVRYDPWVGNVIAAREFEEDELVSLVVGALIIGKHRYSNYIFEKNGIKFDTRLKDPNGKVFLGALIPPSPKGKCKIQCYQHSSHVPFAAIYAREHINAGTPLSFIV